jgi:hypothetical protein
MLKGLMPLSKVRPTYTGGAQRLLPGSIVALKAAANGDYVCGSPLLANCTTNGQPESYQVVDAGNGNIALLSLANNEYVEAGNAGASSLAADQTTVGSAETFTEVDAEGGYIGLLAMANDKYVTAGSSPLIANSTTVGSAQSFTVVVGTGAPATTGPFGGTPAAIPGTVMAENYDTGGQGAGYSVTSVNGTDNSYRSDGVDLETATAPAIGNDLGWTAAGQWFNYTVKVATAGTYTVSFLVAAPSAVTDAFHLSSSPGTNLSGSVSIPATGGWQTWATVTATVTLSAGEQTLTLDEDNAGWNFDSAAFALSTSTSTNVVVTANNQTMTAGSALPTLTYTLSPAVTPTTAPKCTTTATSSSAAGSYPITCSGAVLSGYTFTYVAGTLTVTAVTPPTGTVYEADATGNAIEGTAVKASCSGCLDGKEVTGIGNGNANYLRIKNITAATSGTYTITVYYLINGSSSFTIQINDKATGPTLNLTGTSTTVPASTSFTATLTAGSSNSVGFFNATAAAPAVDHIVVSSN